MRNLKVICWICLPFLLFILSSADSKRKDFYYWAAMYNDSTLFDSKIKEPVEWKYTLVKNTIRPKDSITLLFSPDCCHEFNAAILIKDSTRKKMIRRFELTDKVAIKDILPYITKENNSVWLLYTTKDAERDGTIVWDIDHTYPKFPSPRLYLTITD